MESVPHTIKNFFIKNGQLIKFDKNQTFIRADDPRPWVYYQVEGLVSVTFTFTNGAECILGYFKPDSVFAQNRSFFEDDGGYLDYTTVTSCSIYRVHRDKFLEQVDSNKDFNREYLNNTLQIRIFTTDRAICLAESRIHNRCIRWLMLMNKYYSEDYGKARRVIVPMTQETIGKFLNVSRESVGKVLHSLIEDDHISLKNKHIFIKEPKKLKELLES